MDKQYDHKQAQAQAQLQWQDEGTYLAQNNPGPLYSVDTPPPTVSGSLHLGHIFSYTQTDVIARYKRMQGFSVFYPFGFDDNGLATERFVEKKLEVRAHTMSRADFIALCLKETDAAEQQFKQLWIEMGLSVDWAACYSTISPTTRAISQASFIKLYQKGFVYRMYEPALYCTTCRTSVAQAELDDAEKASFFNDIIFKDQEGNDLIIGTTRPELLSSCVALLYNPADERYMHLEGKKARVPIFNNEVPIFADEAVSIEKGTGLVMCCTFGDKTDIAWFKKFNLPYKQSVGFDGKWTEQTGILAGLTALQAREKIIQELKDHNLLLAQRPIQHAVNVHERCKKEIEYLLLSQWFLKILAHKKQLIQQAEHINWYPAFMKTRYINWVENISWDWCLSRQRFYGIPFPAWHCTDCGQVILADINSLPIDPQETPYHGSCPACKGTSIKPDTDVMDTWNTSSLTPYICADLFNKQTNQDSALNNLFQTTFIPMGMRPQAHDIIRTWAFYTIAKTWMHQDTIPWKDIVISGHVLSDAKEKLSKSKDGGKLSPEALLAQYSVDAIRYWTASCNIGYDTAFSENQLKIGQRLVTKLWNAFRFIAEHPYQGTLKDRPQHFETYNAWLLHSLTETEISYHSYMKRHEFGLALDTIEKFFWHTFCDNYIEVIKHQLFNPQHYAPDQVAATQWTLYYAGLRILQLYAPYIPYVTETIYRQLYASSLNISSVHQTKFAAYEYHLQFPESAHLMLVLLDIVAQVRRLKTEKQLSLKTPLQQLEIYITEPEILTALQHHDTLLKGVTQSAAITYAHDLKESTLQSTNEAWYAIVSYQPKTTPSV